MSERSSRIEAYLKDYEQLSPEQQRQHYQLALRWIVEALYNRVTELDASAPQHPPHQLFQ